MFDKIQTAYNSLSSSTQTILLICLIVGLIVLVICLILKLFKIAIGIAIFLILVPNLFTIFFGNGTETVNKLSQYLDPGTGQKVTDSYEYFKEKDKEIGGVNSEKVKDTWNSAVTIK